MRRLTLVAIGVCLAGSTGLAQDPVKVSPKNYHVVIDNAQVRVLHVIAAPGEKTAMHQHPDNMTVVLTDGKIDFTDGDGKTQTVDMKAGQAMWSGPQKHMGANGGATALEAIVVELKGSAPPKATLPASRPRHHNDEARGESARRRRQDHFGRLVQGRAEDDARLRPGGHCAGTLHVLD